MSNTASKIVISSGEPSGIGPDITLMAAQHEFKSAIAVCGCPQVLQSRAEKLGIKVKIEVLSDGQHVSAHKPGQLFVIPIETQSTVETGALNTENSQYVINCINQATDNCLSQLYDAMVTAPVNKSIINDAGIAFSGHTEWIADRTGGQHPVMMLADERMKVCLATTHLPLRAVPEAITEKTLIKVLTIINADLIRLYRNNNPKIAVCGLNPHAGEGGHLGREEIDVIQPVIEKLNVTGRFNLIGPVPADTLFTQANLASVDAVLAMYHDQGLPVVKHSGFGEVVNITLGLPIIRTSVDHGTALDLAGTGKASETSMVAAIRKAIELAQNQRPS